MAQLQPHNYTVEQELKDLKLNAGNAYANHGAVQDGYEDDATDYFQAEDKQSENQKQPQESCDSHKEMNEQREDEQSVIVSDSDGDHLVDDVMPVPVAPHAESKQDISTNKIEDESNRVSPTTATEDEIILQQEIEEVKKLPLAKLPSRKRLAAILDVFDNPIHVLDVAKQCDLTRVELDKLELHCAGGGNPALAFFEHLCVSCAAEKMFKLKESFRKFKMVKAATIIEDYDDNETLEDILPKHVDKLASVTMKTWEDVAEDFKLQENISMFNSAVKTNNSYSCTQALLRLIDVKYYKEVNIGVFLSYVAQTKHVQAVDELSKQIKELAKERLTAY